MIFKSFNANTFYVIKDIIDIKARIISNIFIINYKIFARNKKLCTFAVRVFSIYNV